MSRMDFYFVTPYIENVITTVACCTWIFGKLKIMIHINEYFGREFIWSFKNKKILDIKDPRFSSISFKYVRQIILRAMTAIHFYVVTDAKHIITRLISLIKLILICSGRVLIWYHWLESYGQCMVHILCRHFFGN